jgi:riboflavin kinase/FMN adenylyltransferase
MVCLHFDAEFASHSAEDFARTVLGEGLAAGHVVVGYDFSYGHARRGNPEVLTASGQELGFGVTIVAPEATAGGAIYSSTKIRDHLQAGEPRAAASLLGRDWEIDGRVEHGDARGRTIGFPTANLDLGEYLRPRPGVYAVRVGIDRAGSVMWHQGVANLGTRPTVAGTDLRFEVHLLDFRGDLYGQLLRVAFVEWIRGEQKFAGLDALKAQIALDAARAREMLTP